MKLNSVRYGRRSGVHKARSSSGKTPSIFSSDSRTRVRCSLDAIPKFHELTGSTPLINLSHLLDLPSHIKLFAKVEWMNPSFSIKDRIARHIFDNAEAKGDLKPGCTVRFIL